MEDVRGGESSAGGDDAMSIPDQLASEQGISKFDLYALAHIPDPYSVYRHLRTETPDKYPPNSRSWLLTRHTDITAVLRDDRFGFPEPVLTLPAWHALIGVESAGPSPRENAPQVTPLDWIRLQEKVVEMRQLWILLLNPPAHTRLRGLVHQHFNLATVGHLNQTIQTTADTLLDKLQERREMDLVHDFAGPLILSVMLQILGVPLRDAKRFHQLARELTHLLHALLVAGSTPHYHRMLIAGVSLTEYFRKLIETRQEPYGDDVIGALIRAHKADKLSGDELLAMCILLSLGGYSTTRSQIGNGLFAMLKHREQWERLQRQPELVGSAVEECLRYDTPGQTAGRVAFANVNLNGVTIKKGDWVSLILGAGNRDPEVFASPERFDITRSPNPHLSFGHGIHYCLGAHLARATLRITLLTLARRLPQMALRGDTLEWSTDDHLRGLKALHVVF